MLTRITIFIPLIFITFLSRSQDDIEWFSEPVIEIENINFLTEGFYSGRKNGKWGIMNIKGEFIISPKYDEINAINDNEELIYQARSGQKWICFNNQGKIILKDYDEIFYNSKQKIYEVSLNNKKGIFSGKKKDLLCGKIEYDEIYYNAKNRFALVSNNKQYSIVNEEGQNIIPKGYRFAGIIRHYDTSPFLIDENKIQYIINEFGRDNKMTIIIKDNQNRFGTIYKNKSEWKTINPLSDTPLIFEDNIDKSNPLFCFKQKAKSGIVNSNNEIIYMSEGQIVFWGNRDFDEQNKFITYLETLLVDGVTKQKLGAIHNGKLIIDFDFNQKNQLNIIDGKLFVFNDDTKEFYILDESGQIIYTKKTDCINFHNGFTEEFRENNPQFHGLVSICEKDGIYLYDNNINRMSNEKMESIDRFSGVTGIALIKRNNKIGCIDFLGNVIIEPNYEKLHFFQSFCGETILLKKKNLCYQIDKKGTIVNTYKLQDIFYVSCEYAVVKKDGVWSILHQDGQIMELKDIPNDFGSDLYIMSSSVNHNVPKISRINGNVEVGVINILDHKFYDIGYSNIPKIKLKAINGYIFGSKKDKKGIKTWDGKILIEPKYDYIREEMTSNGTWFFVAQIGNRIILIDTLGQTIVSGEYDNITIEEKYGKLAIITKGKKVGFFNINKKEWAFNMQFINISEESDIYIIKRENLFGLISKNTGTIITPISLIFISPYSEGYAVVQNDTKFGYIDTNGKYIITPIFEDARPFNEGFAWVKQNGKWGVIKKPN